MKQKGLPVRQAGLAPIVIVILIAAVTSLGGYLLYNRQAIFIPKPQKSDVMSPTSQPTPTPTSTPSSIPNETVQPSSTGTNGQTYTPEEVIAQSTQLQNKEIQIIGVIKLVALGGDKISGLGTGGPTFSTKDGMITVSYTREVDNALGKRVSIRGIYEKANTWPFQIGILRIPAECQGCVTILE